MSELPNVSPGEIIASAHINDIADRSVQRYTDAANLAALNPNPVQGELAYLEDVLLVQVFDGSQWQPFLNLAGGTMEGPIVMPAGNLTVTMAERLNLMSFQDDAGVQIFELNPANHQSMFADGSVSTPSITFSAQADSGFYRSTAGVGRASYVSAGVDRIWIDNSGLWLRTATSTGDAANISADASNLLRKSTSARRYKNNIESAAGLAGLVLEPVTFHRDDDDKDFIGFIADDMPDERAIEYGDDGEVENYDVRAVVAILAAKVNELTARVEALEA